MTESTHTFDELSDDDIATLTRQMAKARHGYAKMNAMDSYVSWGERDALLWHLTRTEAYATWEDPELWRELVAGLDSATPDDVAEFLSKIESIDADELNISSLVSDWPLLLDHMVCQAYAEDAEAIESRRAEFSKPVQRGLQLVLRRFGKIDADDIDSDVIQELAYEQVTNDGFADTVYMVRDGEFARVELQDYKGRKPAFFEFIELYGSREDWAQAILAEAQNVEYNLDVDKIIEAWHVADRDQLCTMLGRANSSPQSVERLYTLFLDERDDAPGDLFWLADQHLGNVKEWVAEVCAAAAIIKLDKVQEPIPVEAVEYISGRSISSSSHRSDYSESLNYLVEAVGKLPNTPAKQWVRDQLTKQYPATQMYLLLQVWPDDDSLVDDALDAMENYVEEHSPNFPGMDQTAHGLGMIGERYIDIFIERLQKSEDATTCDTLQRAVLYTLADLAERDGDFDEKYDPWVRFSGWQSKDTDPYYFGHYLTPDLKKIVAHLPQDRVEALLSDQLRSDDAQWGRALEGVAARQTDKLLGVAFDELAEADELPKGGRGWNWMERFFRELGDEALTQLGGALSRSESPDFHNAVQTVLGKERYQEMLDEYGCSAIADDSDGAKIRRLSKQLFEKRPKLSRTTICFLSRGEDSPAEDSLSRIGGPPIGIDADHWPHRNGDDNQPMEHMITLDVQALPPLADRLDETIRAVSLFVHNPSHNEAWMPYNQDAEVLLLSHDEVKSGPFEGEMPAGDEEALAITVQEVEVPAELFTLHYDDDDTELREIRDLVYKSNAYCGGMPLWLQGDESTGSHFLMQFDEGLVWMNLGDVGVMYVFTDTAFWQCH